MENKSKKLIKTLLWGIIIISVFVISFIFVNNKISLNSKVKGDVLGAQSILVDKTTEDNKILADNEITQKTSGNISKTIVDPYYYGVGAKGLTPLQVSMLIKDFKRSTASFVTTVSPVNQVWYFAYPDSYPALKSIKDSSGFELIQDFKVTTGNDIINSLGHNITYRIYEFNNIVTVLSYKVTYIQL